MVWRLDRQNHVCFQRFCRTNSAVLVWNCNRKELFNHILYQAAQKKFQITLFTTLSINYTQYWAVSLFSANVVEGVHRNVIVLSRFVEIEIIHLTKAKCYQHTERISGLSWSNHSVNPLTNSFRNKGSPPSHHSSFPHFAGLWLLRAHP